MKKEILSVTLCIAITALAGCNSSTELTSVDSKIGSSQTSNSIESDYEETIEYAPTEEILNAKFNSGLVQLNNDVFQQGGYITVEEFVEKYKDRYSIRYHYPVDENKSRISPYENCKDYLIEYKKNIFNQFFFGSRWGERLAGIQGFEWRNYLELTPKYGDTENIVKAYVINATSKDEKITLNKAIIAAVDSYNGEIGHRSYAAPEWFPKGFNDVYMLRFEKLKCSNKDYSLSQVPQILEKESIVISEGIEIKDRLNKYWDGKTNNNHDCIRFWAVGEKNLFGARPVFDCEFEFDPNTDKVKRFTEDLSFFLVE